jgi:putative drug exporter of the RND superfamily
VTDRTGGTSSTVQDQPRGVRLRGLGRLGRFISTHHRWFALVWLAVLVGALYLGAFYQKSISNDFRVPNTDSQSAYDLLGSRFPSQDAATATVVFSATGGGSVTSAEEIGRAHV